MGRHRSQTLQLPPGIEANRLPQGIYWDASGRGRWYVIYHDETGRRHTRRVAGPGATLADLQRLATAEYGSQPTDSFAWVTEQFQRSPIFRALAPATQSDYHYCHAIVAALPARSGGTLGNSQLRQWNRPMVQRIVDHLAEARGPSAANHALRYLRRLFRWAANRGHLSENPAEGVETARERQQRRLPTPETYRALLDFARQQSGSAYLAPVMELAYLCRLRAIEVLDLTDASASDEGLTVVRRKGSRGNITEWSPRLRTAWEELQEQRQQAWERHRRPPPLRAEERRLVVGSDGHPLQRSGLASAWQRLIARALASGTLDPAQRFGLHDLKRAGITRTRGTRAEKQEASGHRSPSMMDVYDQSVPRVRPVEE